MARPDDRPLRVLPTLTARKSALETCVFCPKLCRSACPVSNVEARETVTPWGKMSTAYFVARGDVPATPTFAQPAWACTGCMACRSSCDHRNDVAGTLGDARAALVDAGIAPSAAMHVVAKFKAHQARTRAGVRRAARVGGTSKRARDALLIGCAYARGAPQEALDAVFATRGLVRAPVALVEACCGLPLLEAGDAHGFARQAEAFAREVDGAERLIVVDAGCALALKTRYPEAGVRVSPEIELFVERAARDVERMRAAACASEAPVRYHDPCRLGRGLGVYDAPRVVLTRALGRAPDEFDARRDRAVCSGGGGQLPRTMPETARAIAAGRAAEHEGAGGGTIVTACGSSLISLRRGGARVADVVSYVARSLPVR